MQKEVLEKRIADLNGAIKNTQEAVQQNSTNLALMEGARRECLYWLQQLDKPVEEIKEEVPG